MKEMLNPTSIVMGAGLGQDVALVTDGRFSGGMTFHPEDTLYHLSTLTCNTRCN